MHGLVVQELGDAPAAVAAEGADEAEVSGSAGDATEASGWVVVEAGAGAWTCRGAGGDEPLDLARRRLKKNGGSCRALAAVDLEAGRRRGPGGARRRHHRPARQRYGRTSGG